MSEDALTTAIEATLPTAVAATSPKHRPFSSELRRVLELARRRGLRLGHSYVGTEHLLLGLIDSGAEPTVGVLASLATADEFAAAVEEAVFAALEEWQAAHADLQA